MPPGTLHRTSVRSILGQTNSQSLLTSAPTNKTKKRYIVLLDKDASADDFCARRGFTVRRQTRNSPPGFVRNMSTNDALVLPAIHVVICDLSSNDARAVDARVNLGRHLALMCSSYPLI